ncbi:MAG: hypothetical protein MZV70_11810, partial [Desulfobacterales bacterium]|nr:hypothetical protein [Desulfobacterales bacterium]
WASSAPSPGARRCAQEIENRLDITALDIYGLSEIMGPGVSMECLEGRARACTSSRTTSSSRSINPDTGEVLPPGEAGELVFTTITKEAFPLIRYRTAGHLPPHAPSPAGAAGPRTGWTASRAAATTCSSSGG